GRLIVTRIVEDTDSSPENRFTARPLRELIRKPESGSEVVVCCLPLGSPIRLQLHRCEIVDLRHRKGQFAVCRPRLGVYVPTQAQVNRQTATRFPIVMS